MEEVLTCGPAAMEEDVIQGDTAIAKEMTYGDTRFRRDTKDVIPKDIKLQGGVD